MTIDIADYLTESWTVTQGVQDALRVLSAQIDKHVVPAFFEMIEATVKDHIDITHTPFVGIIPAVDMTLATAANKANLTGYDYAWYLTVQYVPSDDRITLEDTNPSETIETLLGGGSWATVTGIEPHQINNVDDWANIKKSFEFGDRCTRWKAIQEICDYCNFVFVVKWRDVAGSWRPCAYFVYDGDSNDDGIMDIDTAGIGLNIPAQVTITNPDSHLIDGVSIKDSPEHQYNKVLVTGYDVATDTYFYAEAKKAGTDIAIEYVYADASLNTQDKTEAKAQELLDFFQASAKVYVARFKQRMDLELYQKINFVGYDKIGTDVMRITRIMYSREAYNDMVEIEFMKDQAVQQLKRLARAVSPDYVSGQQDMINSDLSDVGLIDVFDDPVAGGTSTDDLWEVSGAYVQVAGVYGNPINLRGWCLDMVDGVRGSPAANFSLWGGDDDGVSITEFLCWHTSNSHIEILKDLYINNDPPNNRFPKIYFDVDPFRPTYIQGNRYDVDEGGFDGFSVVVGGTTMLKFTNPYDASEYLEVMRDLIINPNLIMGGSIKGYGVNNLVFWDNATGTKTLKQLSEGGGGEHTHSAADITSGILAMVRGGTANNHGDAESVGGYSLMRLIGTPTEIASGDCYGWTWYVDNVKAVTATPDLSYENEVACGTITSYVTKQEEADDEVTVWVYNGTGTSQYIGVRGVAFCY